MSLTSRKGDDGFPEPAHSFMSALAKAGMQRFGEKPEVDAVPCQLHPLARVVRCFPFCSSQNLTAAALHTCLPSRA